MILLHNEKSTINSFQFDQFGNDSKEVDSSNKAGSDIVLPSFEKELIEHTIEDNEIKEAEIENHDKSEESSILLKELEKREAQLLEKEKRIIEEANQQVEEMIKQAQLEAERIKENVFEQASQEGYQDGYQKAYQEHKEKMDEETAVFLLQLRDLIQAFEEEKTQLISQNIDELKELAISIAEKVIQISLKTSGEIIKKMIITATNKMKLKEWAKIYISKNDSALIVESNADLLDAISHLSEHIKIVVMEDSAPGTCIIELPDQIIDASASTQIENIRAIMKSAGRLGGNDIV
ncbi:FliH/SctL family protein [Anaerotignum propionicum]|jgi:flagellar assembly protein FliH|uniref:Flagellar assembly protein FliH n=2 Tax=root TaxID=1 RepID=A0A0X8VBD5_ANAPI|nr:FliH/SctL family protein [Anaerotignum propionicum]AMJ39916.1 flagellar assembly protein H [Anaerotignum propionicum DSM 1682]MEA5056316.1 FliH/SctL family protein [Anaerotignum propionicum]SHE27358.1 flagellar assembly protein FliH [[Clostridium] propionicum DSM 1682] [Anaerotignum propionicum DSM 1682]